jgi:dienelactone hydrolase
MRAASLSLAFLLSAPITSLLAQSYGPPDRAQPGDLMIQRYLQNEAGKLGADFLGKTTNAEQWVQERPRFLAEYFDMLGLSPLPEKTPLLATVTRTLDRGEYVVEMVQYQSRPGLYVTANLYRPARIDSGQRLPAVLYVCGHSGRGRNGVKTAFQSHGIWFARHGYVCFVLDTLQLGEIAGVHHGTYREGRWWWLSRGYTPAGVECWNGIRGIDYLVTRPEVDPDRISVTGISGGGAATYWIAAADERVKVAVPVSGMADLESYVSNRVVNGHCDCMFLYNTYQWPWTRIAALIAPRPLLFVNSDHDSLFPMDANERVINRLERLYSLFGKGDLVDSFVSIGGHAYRQDIRQGTFRFLNTYLKDDSRPVLDSEVDLVTGPREEIHPIPPEQLRVFPLDSDIPADALNGRIDQEFVPMGKPALPGDGSFATWQKELADKLRRVSFHHFPGRVPIAHSLRGNPDSLGQLETEPDIEVRLRALKKAPDQPDRVLLLVTGANIFAPPPLWLGEFSTEHDAVYVCEPRGIGTTEWTGQSPPNYVARSHYLLGRTVDSGRVWDIAATARYLRSVHGNDVPVFVAGDRASAVLAAYAALLEPDIQGLVLSQPPATHMDPSAPALLNVLRVCDIPEVLGLLAPRQLTIVGGGMDWAQKVQAIYRAAGAADKLNIRPAR